MPTPTSDIAYVWVWLPDTSEPVVAGLVQRRGKRIDFAYGDSYLARTDAISLYEPELPLRQGWLQPLTGMSMPSCIRDGSPDSWGRRVLADHGIDVDDEITLMLESGSNRFGALDFQPSPTNCTRRQSTATLDALHAAAQGILSRREVPPEAAAALVHGTTIGGARPKVLVAEGHVEHVAKLSTAADTFPAVRAEAAAQFLARHSGIDIPDSKLVTSLGRDVLLAERFDRTAGGGRRMVVSGLTMNLLDEMSGRHATYPDMLDVLRRYGARLTGRDVGEEVFRRIVFNIAIGNTDDHARNHAAFWDGHTLTLTPAYDLTPQPRAGGEASQAMAFDRKGTRDAQFAAILDAASVYGLSSPHAREIIDNQIDVIDTYWHDAADIAHLTRAERNRLHGTAILNPYSLYDYPRTQATNTGGRQLPGGSDVVASTVRPPVAANRTGASRCGVIRRDGTPCPNTPGPSGRCGIHRRR